VAALDFLREWLIVVPADADATTLLAARELQQVLLRVTGRLFPIGHETREDRPQLLLGHSLGQQEGFTWRATAAAVRLEGESGRGLLYAVYSFLESLGCRWVGPGPDGERLPSSTLFSVPDEAVHDAPRLPGRCLILGHHAFLKDFEAWISWAARNRMNTVFVHVTDEPWALGSAPERQWQRVKQKALALLRERGMTLEHGGHGLTAMVPRPLFRESPEAFRQHDGQRKPDHNFCPSSAVALRVLRQNAEAYFRARPEVDVFHLWPDDIPGGGWCGCPECQGLSPSEQALLAVNAAAEALENVNPDASLSFLAYHDTEAVPAAVRPRRNVALLWAPRMRCYAHATDDPACPVNARAYAAGLVSQVAHFLEAEARPTRVFEYYLDAILFKSVLPPLPTVMQADLRFYARAGVHTVQALMTGDRPWLGPELNPWLFARLAWNPERDGSELLADYCQAVFGDGGPELVGFFRALEAAYALALDLGPQERQVVFDGLGSVVRQPPVDMGDPVFAPTDVLLSKAQSNARIEDWIHRAERHLEAARETCDPEVWGRAQQNLELHRAWLLFDLSRVQLYAATTAAVGAEASRVLLEQAEQHYRQVQAWGRRSLQDGRYRRNFRLQHFVFWGLRLLSIRRDHFAHRWTRSWLAARARLQLLVDYLLLRRAYDRD
jgi:hypothetical protein